MSSQLWPIYHQQPSRLSLHTPQHHTTTAPITTSHHNPPLSSPLLPAPTITLSHQSHTNTTSPPPAPATSSHTSSSIISTIHLLFPQYSPTTTTSTTISIPNTCNHRCSSSPCYHPAYFNESIMIEKYWGAPVSPVRAGLAHLVPWLQAALIHLATGNAVLNCCSELPSLNLSSRQKMMMGAFVGLRICKEWHFLLLHLCAFPHVCLSCSLPWYLLDQLQEFPVLVYLLYQEAQTGVYLAGLSGKWIVGESASWRSPDTCLSLLASGASRDLRDITSMTLEDSGRRSISNSDSGPKHVLDFKLLDVHGPFLIIKM